MIKYVTLFQELQEMRNQIQHVEKQKVRIESDYKSKYEGIMTEKLQELRDIYDEENEKLTNDVQSLYLAKVRGLQVLLLLFLWIP